MEEDHHFDTLQDFKNALENWYVDAKFRYRVKKSDKYAQSQSNYACLLTTIRKRSINIYPNDKYPFHIDAAWSNQTLLVKQYSM